MPDEGARILVIEDEVPIRRFLRASLQSHGFVTCEAESGTEGLKELLDRPPELVLLDLGLPDMEGLDLIRRTREWSTVPIVVLSARGQEADKVAALDAGADDYLTKPFGMGELLARVRVHLRRQARLAAEDAPVFQSGPLSVDLARRVVTLAEREVHLTPNEYRLLTTLVKHAGKVLTHRQLLKEVWGPGSMNETHYLRVYMGQLRQKLESDPARPELLLTEPGVGYRLATRS